MNKLLNELYNLLHSITVADEDSRQQLDRAISLVVKIRNWKDESDT